MACASSASCGGPDAPVPWRAWSAARPRARQVGLDAAAAAAVAGQVGQAGPDARRHLVVAPLAADRVGADPDAAAMDDAAADAGAQDHAEDHRRAGAGAVARLGEREAVGVVLEPHLAAERIAEIAPERHADELRRVGVLDQAGGRRHRARHADAHRAAAADACLEALDHLTHGQHRGAVVARRRGDAQARQLAARGIDGDRLDLGAAEIDADAHVRCWRRGHGRCEIPGWLPRMLSNRPAHRTAGARWHGPGGLSA